MVMETAMPGVLPKVSCIAVASGRSAAGGVRVDVHDGSTMLPSFEASRSARVAPSAAGSGAVDVVGVGDTPVPASSA